MTDPIYDETKLVNPLSIQSTTAITQIYTLFNMGKSLEEVVDALVTSGTTIDATITEASTHPVQSAAIYTALAGKASVDLSDADVGSTHAGKVLAVDEDGTIKFDTVAATNLSNVNVGVGNAGKTLMVDADGTIKFVLVE